VVICHTATRGMIAFAEELFRLTDGTLATGPGHFNARCGSLQRG
jgi:hypothetical protein